MRATWTRRSQPPHSGGSTTAEVVDPPECETAGRSSARHQRDLPRIVQTLPAREHLLSAAVPSREGDEAQEGVASDPLRDQLLEATARVFAREGYDGTKILDTVAEAGRSTGAVYGRFG